MLQRQLRLLAMILCPIGTHAQTAADSVVSVTVTRTARVAPNRATVFIGVEGTAESAGEAVRRATATMTTVVDALQKLGTDARFEAPQTVSIGDNPALRGYPAAQLPPSRVARSVVRVVVTRPESLARIVAAALDAGAKGTSGMLFESTVADSVRLSMLREMVAQGRGEAEALASAHGGRLGALVGSSTMGGPNFPQTMTLGFDASYGGIPAQSPEVMVNVTLILRYRLVR